MSNKNRFLFAAVVSLLLAGCKKDLVTDSNPEEPKAPVQINFTEHNLFPEGLTYDPLHNRFYVSSASRGTVGIVSFDGTYKPFISNEALTQTNGLRVDVARQRLWVCNAPNGVGAYDLNTGAQLFFTDLTVLLPGEPIFINDVTLDPQGNAYVTNSFSPVIYKIDRYGKASIFFHNTAFATAPGDFGFNGIQYDERGFLLVNHTTLNEIIKISVRNPTVYLVVQLDASLSFPDGLLLSKNGNQLVVVNEDRVLSFISNDQWKSGSLSTLFNTGSEVFTTSVTSDGKRVYVLYSHLNKFLSGEDQETFTIQEVPLKNPGRF
jgi:DNA-binding beta-propeller fold protein YncE